MKYNLKPKMMLPYFWLKFWQPQKLDIYCKFQIFILFYFFSVEQVL